MMTAEARTFSGRVMVALAAVLLVLVAGSAWSFRAQERAARHEVEERLTSIARLKAGQITAWREERLGDAAVLAEDPFFAEGLQRFLANPRDENARGLLARFRSLQAHFHYADVLLIDPAGGPF